VADDLAEAIGPPVKPKPWEADLTWLMGIDVVVTPDSAPGSWRLIRHDHCEVIDVAGPDGEPDYGKSYVSHQGCTILAESRPAA
jgi:hypothetical protein